MPAPEKDPTTMAKRFLSLCATVLMGVILLYLAVWLLSLFWGWLVLLSVAVIVILVIVRVMQAHRNRW